MNEAGLVFVLCLTYTVNQLFESCRGIFQPNIQHSSQACKTQFFIIGHDRVEKAYVCQNLKEKILLLSHTIATEPHVGVTFQNIIRY